MLAGQDACHRSWQRRIFMMGCSGRLFFLHLFAQRAHHPSSSNIIRRGGVWLGGNPSHLRTKASHTQLISWHQCTKTSGQHGAAQEELRHGVTTLEIHPLPDSACKTMQSLCQDSTS